MTETFAVQDFFRRFPDDDACLDYLFRLKFGEDPVCPKCGEVNAFHRLRKMPAYTCNCGHHIHPMAGTIFKQSRTSLQKWFYATYLFTTTRHGVPAKELQRQLSVTYKCAWRMGHQIRKHMTKVDGDPPLSGHVEADETYIGGRRSGGKRGRGSPGKTVVFGMTERGGDVMTPVVANARKATLERHILENIRSGSTISTDEWIAYRSLAKHGYTHGTVDHSVDQWVDGIHHTNTLEGFWSMLKRSIRGTHIHVSRKHMPKYLGEFEFRWNLRHAPETMFARLLMSF